MTVNQPTAEFSNSNVPRKKSNPPKPLGPLKWKKSVNNFEPNIHKFTKNQVIILNIDTCYFIFMKSNILGWNTERRI